MMPEVGILTLFQITTGDGNVTQVLRVDEKARTIYFVGAGKEPGRDPYFRHFYRINLDGSGAKLLTPEDGDHTSWCLSNRQTSRSSRPPVGSRRCRLP